MDLRDRLLLTVRDLRLAVRRLPYVRGRGRLLEMPIARFYLGRRSPIRCKTVHQTIMTVDPRDPGVQQQIWNIGEYESSTSRLLIRILEPGDVFFDIGAHVGYYTCLTGRLLSRGHVVAVEPNPPMYQLLTENIMANKLDNVTALRRAVWHWTGQKMELSLEMVSPEAGTPSTQFVEAPLGTEAGLCAETICIDDLVDDLTCGDPTVMKLDVEGAEYNALKGANNTLARSMPVLIVEYNDESAAAFGYSSRELMQYIREEHGYRLFVHEFGRNSPHPELRPFTGIGVRAGENVICIGPKDLAQRDWPLSS